MNPIPVYATDPAGAANQATGSINNPASVDSGFGALLRAPRPDAGSDVAICDWDDLFNAVKERLKTVTAECPSSVGKPSWPCSARQVKATVLECTAALDHLHQTLAHELGRRQQLELEVFDAQTALAQARAELVGTQAGERRARHLALHDSLTSLPNRGFFIERLDHALALAAPQRRGLTVMYLDLDGFKPVNDNHGHAAGDELLRIVAARLRRAVRAEDMVSRIGGDEFACLLGGLHDREQLGHLAAKVFDAVSAPCKIGALRVAVHPSIGIAVCPDDGSTSEILLQNADTAMYAAKRQQTGHAFFQSL